MPAKSLPVPCVVGGARIQIMEDTKWRIVAECLDTPRGVRETVERLKAEGHKNLWYQDCIGYRKPLF